MQANQAEVFDAQPVPARVESAVSTNLTGGEALLSQALAQGASIETLERLMDLRERMLKEQAQKAFLEAMAGFQGDCPVIGKGTTAQIETKSGAKFDYKYASLDQIIETVRPILKQWGLCYTIDTVLQIEGNLSWQVATCTIHHVMGHSMTSTFKAPVDLTARMNDMQKGASAQTYAKRYAICNALGIVTGDQDDDGGHGGSTRPQTQQATQGPQRKSETQQRAAQTASIPQMQEADPPRDAKSGEWIKGPIEKLDMKEDPKGQWKLWTVQIKGGWYGTFAKDTGEALIEHHLKGRVIWINWNLNKKGNRNILGVEVE